MSTIKKSNSKCLGCGGNLIYDPQENNLVCENCKSIKNFDKNFCIDKKDYKIIDKTENKISKTTNCSNCGASLDVIENRISLHCPYCNSNFVLDDNEILGLKPDLIIPFKFNKNKAFEHYKNGVKKQFFLPNKFKNSPTFNNIYGTYIPSFCFDADTNSTYFGSLTCSKTTRLNGQTHTTRYTKNINGTKQMSFNNIFVEASNLTEQKSFNNILPFKLEENETYSYSGNFIRGYKVESYEDNLISCKVMSENLINKKIEKAILSNYSYDFVNYLNINTTFLNNKYAYVLVPVYFIDIKYKNKIYHTYLNGQTGKLGKNLPKSGVKIIFLVLGIILFFASFFILPLLFK